MSFVTNLMFSNMATMTRSNANFGTQMVNNSKMGLLNSINADAKYDEVQLKNIHNLDKKLTFASLQNQLQAKIAATIEEVLMKKQKKDIEKEFSTFA